MSRRKKGFLGCGGALLGFFILMLIIGLIVGPQKTAPTASTAVPASTTSTPSAVPRTPKPTTAATHKPTPKPSPRPSKPSPSPSSCDPGPDVLVWYRVPSLNDSAQTLGSRGGVDCSSTFDLIRTTSPTGDGYCTEAAWASDNPGYNPDADPAPPLNNVQVSVGPACDSVAGGSSGGSSGGGSGTAPILSPSGNYYRAGEFCPQDDDGLSTVDANGNTITCSDVNGYYRWHY